MAEAKKTKKIIKKQNLKPEEILRAKKRSVGLPQKPLPKPVKPAPKKRHKKTLSLKKLGQRKVKNPICISIIAIFLAIVVIIVWVLVAKSVKETNNSLDASEKSANGMYIVAKKEADLIRVIGTKLKRQSEVVNYQSAPADLQKFIDADYKAFKQQCMVNGKITNNVGYEVTSIVYDSYAVIKRNCDGNDTLILKKFDTKWAVVFSGNVLPTCSTVNDFDIPQGASMNCEQNGVVYLNPNP